MNITIIMFVFTGFPKIYCQNRLQRMTTVNIGYPYNIGICILYIVDIDRMRLRDVARIALGMMFRTSS